MIIDFRYMVSFYIFPRCFHVSLSLSETFELRETKNRKNDKDLLFSSQRNVFLRPIKKVYAEISEILGIFNLDKRKCNFV